MEFPSPEGFSQKKSEPVKENPAQKNNPDNQRDGRYTEDEALTEAAAFTELVGGKAASGEYDLAEKLVDRTKELFIPERMDILIEAFGKDLAPDEKEKIISATCKDLLSQLEGADPQWTDKIEKNLETSLKKRKRMLSGLDQYLKSQEGLPRELRDHQLKALEKIRDFVETGYLRGYVSHPTGAGKTVLFSSLIKLTGARTLIVVPKRILIKQEIEELKRFFPDKKISFLGSIAEKHLKGLAEKGSHGDIVITVDKSFIENSQQVKNEDFDLVIWDEAHKSYTPNAQDALKHFPSAIKLGFTATPDYLYTGKRPGCEEIELDGSVLYRNPDRSAGHFYPHMIDDISLKQAIETGMLVSLHASRVDMELDLDEVGTAQTTYGTDFNEKALSEFLAKHWPTLKSAVMQSMAEGVDEVRFENLQIFVVCSNIAQAKDLAKEFRKNGYSARHIVGETSPKDRDKILDDYKHKKIQILTSVNVLAEGWDMPEAEVCLMLRPTLSRTFYQQAVGRVLRLNPDHSEKHALVIDFQGKYEKMNLMSAPALFGITEFYNGQMLVPKKTGSSGGSGEGPEIFGTPLNIKPKLKTIEKIESAEIVSDGVAVLKNRIYFTKSKLLSVFPIQPDSFSTYIKESQPLSLRLGKNSYYDTGEIIKTYLDRDFSADYLSLREIARDTRLSEWYVKSIIEKHRRGISSRKEYTYKDVSKMSYRMTQVWNCIKGELNNSLMREIGIFKNIPKKSPREESATPQSGGDERIDLFRADLLDPQVVRKVLAQFASQDNNVGIRKTLENITIREYSEDTGENLQKIKTKWNHFEKIATECDRLLENLEKLKPRE